MDHVINDPDAFHRAISNAEKVEQLGYLATFGIEPASQKTAGSYLTQDRYFWNSGMFLFRADIYLDALRVYQPDVLQACEQAMQQTRLDGDFIRVDAEAFFSKSRYFN